jgi:YebC/PmpR family DNA-binding regulatory protein
MSGHSKWSTIKRKKGAVDAKRGRIFTKLIKEITIAAREGGGDPGGNPRLRTAILAGKAQNMPADNIDRAIKKGTGELEGVNYEELNYEGYGPGGVAILIETLTDNKNRTTSDVRHMLAKYGGNLGENGCVAWMFDKKGVLTYEPGTVDSDKLMEAALEAGAEDIKEYDESVEVITDPTEFHTVRDALIAAGLEPVESEISKIPQTMVPLEGKQAASMLKLMEGIEDLDDVQNVWANFDISQEEMERLA